MHKLHLSTGHCTLIFNVVLIYIANPPTSFRFSPLYELLITLEILNTLYEAIGCMQWYVEANRQWLHPRRKLFSPSWPLGRASYSAPSRRGPFRARLVWGELKSDQQAARATPCKLPPRLHTGNCSNEWEIFGGHITQIDPGSGSGDNWEGGDFTLVAGKNNCEAQMMKM